MKKHMVNTGENAATGGVKLELKRQMLSKLVGGGLRRLYFKNHVQINQLSNAIGAGCTDTGS